MNYLRIAFVSLVLGGVLALLLVPPNALAAEVMEWSFSELNDPDNKGRLTARLSYGVPETDNIQVSGVCDGTPSTGAAFSSVTFGADSGDLRDGAETELRFSGGGFDHVLKGAIYRPRAEEGISGVHLDVPHDDPLWQALQEKDTLDYLVPGYRASTLDLTRGRDKIKSFIESCRAYAKAILGDDAASVGTDAAASSGSTPEKEAFESAKELGTAEAWNAFLTSYPSGFHADLARAYLKKLGEGSASAKPDEEVTGLSVTYVEYPEGVFIKNGPDTWVEQRKAGGDALRFKETLRSKDEVKLFDKSRKVHISLNIMGGAIWYAPDGSPLKKLYDIVSTRGTDGSPPPPVAPQAVAAAALPTETATNVSCTQLGSIRSKYSNRPTKITFVNNSGGYRGVLWIDFKGQPKDYANLQAGQQVTFDTFQSHPWMVTDGPGNCLQIALPRSGPSLVKIGKAAAPAPKKETTKKCRRGYLSIDGRCVRKRDAATHCGPGYRLQGNKCVQGYQPPQPQVQRPSWQIEAIKKGCAPGLAWNSQEGCHEND
jgi:hypothetical protein